MNLTRAHESHSAGVAALRRRGSIAALGLLLGVGRPALATDHYGYALVDPASRVVTGYNSRGGTIEVTRYDRLTGVSVVTFRRLADPRFGGHVQVTSAGFNAGAAYCKIRSWDANGTDVNITVTCYDMVTKRPMQEPHKYSVLYLADHELITPEADIRGAPDYLWTASATGPIAVPEHYSTSDRAHPITVSRRALGSYRVEMNPYALASFRIRYSDAIVLVTGYGPDNRYCGLETPVFNYSMSVICNGDTGREDSQFTLLVLGRDLRHFPAARAMVADFNSLGGTLDQPYMTNGGSIRLDGQWLILSPELPHLGGDQNAVFMTPFDGTVPGGLRCRPDTWGRSPPTGAERQMNIKPECFDGTGRLFGGHFYMLVLGPPASIRGAPIVAPTPVATATCGAPEGSPAPDPALERYFDFRGDHPADANPGWHENAMGLAHDQNSWYVTQYRPSRVWQIRTDRLAAARCDFDGVQCTTSASWPLPNAALAPLGDPAVFQFRSGPSRAGSPYLLVPIVIAPDRVNPGGSYVVVLTGRLDYVTAIRLPEVDYITWVAVDGKGCLYTSQFGNTVGHEPEVRELFRYVVDWNAIVRRETVTPRAPERIPLSAGFQNVRGGEIAPSGLTLYLVAEGVHAIDLRTGSLIRSSTNGGASCFNFGFDPSTGERPSGLTIWDYDFRDPRITGQLHVIVRDDDASADEIRIKHYSASPSCR